MLRILALTTILAGASPALAQGQMNHGTGQMNHSMGTMGQSESAANEGGSMGMHGGMSMNGSTPMSDGMEMGNMPGMPEMMHGMMKMMAAMQNPGAAQGVGGSPLSEPGQGAFAAIAEAIAALDADPNTDWSKVNIRALRDHLRDMDLVTIWSQSSAKDIPGGQVFTVTGNADVAPSIQRMLSAHARVMNGVDGWHYTAENIEGGARLSVTVPEADLTRLKALGFYGILASGMHHQPHHWMIASGINPHQ